jgi:hypothetical protein
VDSNLGDPSTGPNAIAIADVNGDGKPDLIAVDMCLNAADCTTGGVAVLLGNDHGQRLLRDYHHCQRRRGEPGRNPEFHAISQSGCGDTHG